MVVKDVLVFADSSLSGLARTRMAADLGMSLGAGLEVCIPAVTPSLHASGGTEFAMELHNRLERTVCDQAREAAGKILSALPDFTGRLDVRTPRVMRGEIAGLAGSLAMTSDMSVAGQPDGAGAGGLDKGLLEGALLRSGRPCLMLPRWEEPRVFGAKIMIAWKNTREAARAVADAVTLLQRAQEVCLVTVRHGPGEDRLVERSLERLERHLGRSGVYAPAPLVLDDFSEGSAILDHAAGWGADLLVMGAYGHSRLYELVLGGVTKTIIRHSPIPVFFSH